MITLYPLDLPLLAPVVARCSTISHICLTLLLVPSLTLLLTCSHYRGFRDTRLLVFLLLILLAALSTAWSRSRRCHFCGLIVLVNFHMHDLGCCRLSSLTHSPKLASSGRCALWRGFFFLKLLQLRRNGGLLLLRILRGETLWAWIGFLELLIKFLFFHLLEWILDILNGTLCWLIKFAAALTVDVEPVYLWLI